VDVDIPIDDWINVTRFYDVLIFNTGTSEIAAPKLAVFLFLSVYLLVWDCCLNVPYISIYEHVLV
jgi:hypothetical protein